MAVESRRIECEHCEGTGMVDIEFDDMYGNTYHDTQGCEYCDSDGKLTETFSQCTGCDKWMWMAGGSTQCDPCLVLELELDDLILEDIEI